MRRIDARHLAHPWMGARSLRDPLTRAGLPISREWVRPLMRKMGIQARYRKPRTPVPAPGHKVYPYLLRERVIDRSNQIWCADVTYIPMARGLLYRVAVMDGYRGKLLAWRLSNTMTADFCVAALAAALARFIWSSDRSINFRS